MWEEKNMEDIKNIKVWYLPKDGIIADIITTKDKSPGEGYIEAPYDSMNHKGEPLAWFDAQMNRIDDDELVKQGKRKDHRGTFYNIEKMSETYEINELDELPREGFTKEVPIKNEAHQFFDTAKKKWVIDTEKKERAEKERTLAKLKAEVSEAERKIIRPMRAIQQNRATPLDIEKFNELDSLCENKRPKITELELELKTA